MQTLLRIFVLVALVLSIPACATKKADCCSTKGKCAPNDPNCKAPAAKKKAS